MANEQINQPVQQSAPPPMPEAPKATQPILGGSSGLPGGVEEVQENPLDRIGSVDPVAKHMKTQMFGLEKHRARSNEMRTIKKKSIDEFREVVLDQFQELLEEFGVDVNNPESISRFIEVMGEVNPDMVVLLETIFRSLQEDVSGVDPGVLSENRDLKERFAKVKAKSAEAEDEEPVEEGMEEEPVIEEGEPVESDQMASMELVDEEMPPTMPKI
jgi:hypothetical protein